MGLGEIVSIFHNATSGDVAIIASGLGTFVATFIVSLWNGLKLLSIGKTTKEVQETVAAAASSAEDAKTAASNAKEETGNKIDKVQQAVQTIKVEINGRIKELIEAKEKAAKMEAMLELRIRAVENSAATWSAALLESAKDAIVGKDLNGVIVSWNIAAEDLFGYTKSEVIGRAASILIPEDSLLEEQFMLSQIKKGIRFDRFKCKRRRKDGHELDLEITITPVKDRDGNPTGICAVYRFPGEDRDIPLDGIRDREVSRGESLGGRD